MLLARFTSILSVGVMCLAAGTVDAQPLTAHTASLECTVVNADLVFVAKIVKLGESKRIDDQTVSNVSIAIEQTLKMEIERDEPYEQLQLQVSLPTTQLLDWIERSCRLLVAYDDNATTTTRMIELTPGRMEILKSDLTLLREPDDVIRAAQDALRRASPTVKRLQSFWLPVPRPIIEKTEWARFHGLSLQVPVDDQLKAWALKSLRSGSYLEREDAARALRYFPSEEQITLLKSVLADPGWGYLRHPQENQGVGVRHYGVRDAAYKTLKSWGVTVDQPLIREEFRMSTP